MTEAREIEVSAKDLPLHCPPKQASAWSMHPRVFLPLSTDGKATCPYCGAQYRLVGEVPRHH